MTLRISSGWLAGLTVTLTSLALLMTQQHAVAAEVAGPVPFGKTAGGEAVELFTLTSKSGVVAKIMTYGATVVSLQVPDRDGKLADVVLGFDDVAGYESDVNQYFGATVGRVCNRVAGGKFTLDGKTYTLAVNNGPNHLHGGVSRSFSKVVWTAKTFRSEAGAGVTLNYHSKDGEEGYPGNVDASTTYTLDDAGALKIDMTAKTDKATPINMTNHCYFNLSGAGSPSALKHELEIAAEQYTPMDDGGIPTGKIEPVAGTALDFTKAAVIDSRLAVVDKTPAAGYDHNYVLAPRQPGEAKFAALLRDPASGRVLEVLTDQPGIQFYTGNYLQNQKGKEGKIYPRRSAVCLEPQHYPDSVNHANFPTTIVKPGQKYQAVVVFKFSADEKTAAP